MAAESVRNHFRAIIQHLRTHPAVTEKVRKVGLGKVAVTAATSSILAPVISEKFPTNVFHYFLILVTLTSTVCIWIGFFFDDVTFGVALELLGTAGLLVYTSLTLGAFLPFPVSLVCWVMGTLFLIPFLDIVIRPRRGAPAAAPVGPPRRFVEVV